MPALTIPEIFYEKWFWFAIAIPTAVIVHLVRKNSPASFSKSDNFFIKHKVTIRKAIDVLLICIILFLWLFPYFLFRDIFFYLSSPESIRVENLMFDDELLLISLIPFSGQSGFFLGLISIFQSNITKTKRIILLFACLLPVVFTALLLLSNRTTDPWSIIRLCLYGSISSWIINAPAIILNIPFIQFAKGLQQKLKFVFGGQSA
jgi:hypothetical protein